MTGGFCEWCGEDRPRVRTGERPRRCPCQFYTPRRVRALLGEWDTLLRVHLTPEERRADTPATLDDLFAAHLRVWASEEDRQLGGADEFRPRLHINPALAREERLVVKVDLERALRALGWYGRMIVWQSFVLGKSDRHIATILRIARDTVKEIKREAVDAMAYHLGYERRLPLAVKRLAELAAGGAA